MLLDAFNKEAQVFKLRLFVDIKLAFKKKIWNDLDKNL